jgi:hypothetical protein
VNVLDLKLEAAEVAKELATSTGGDGAAEAVQVGRLAEPAAGVAPADAADGAAAASVNGTAK